MELSQNSCISSDEGTKGFDLSAGKTWIYPENYPIRDYQFNIVQACLYKNTLVCLPTGKLFFKNIAYKKTYTYILFLSYIYIYFIRIRIGENIYCCGCNV